jgi:hypothetical protein
MSVTVNWPVKAPAWTTGLTLVDLKGCTFLGDATTIDPPRGPFAREVQLALANVDLLAGAEMGIQPARDRILADLGHTEVARHLPGQALSGRGVDIVTWIELVATHDGEIAIGIVRVPAAEQILS